MSNNTRERILAAAERLFAQEGYHGTGTAAIIAASEVSRGSFFYHFKDKAALINQVLASYVQRELVTPLANLLASDCSTAEALVLYIDSLEGWHGVDNYRYGCLLSSMMAELGNADPDTRTHLTTLMSQWREPLEQHIQRVALGINRHDFITLYLAALQQALLHSRVHKDLMRGRQDFAACRALVNAGVK